jgi:hypothetical protein
MPFDYAFVDSVACGGVVVGVGVVVVVVVVVGREFEFELELFYEVLI